MIALRTTAPGADGDAGQQHRAGDLGALVDVAGRRQHRRVHRPTGHHHARRQDRVERRERLARVALDQLRRRLRAVARVDRPLAVVEVEHRQRRDQVHVRGVVGTHRPDVAPVAAVAVVGARHLVVLVVVDGRLGAVDEPRHDVAAHVVLGALALGVAGDRLGQGVGVEDVVAHRGQHLVGSVGQPLGVLRLLQERPDPVRRLRVDVDHPELVGEVDRLPDRRHGAARARLDVLVDHVREVHPVDVVGAHDDDDVGPLVGEQVQRLVDRVGAAEVPALADALLRRHRRDVVAEQRRHPPRRGDVPVEAVRLVLREHDDLQEARVHDVGQGEVDQPVDAAERHRRLGPVGGEWHQPLALTASEHDRQDVLPAR